MKIQTENPQGRTVLSYQYHNTGNFKKQLYRNFEFDYYAGGR